MRTVRTTITLDADTEALIRRRMKERGVSFKEAVNDAIREGAAKRVGRGRFRTEAADMGLPTVNLDQALRLAAELEGEETLRKMRAGK